MNFYLAISAINWVTTLVFFADCNQKLKNEGYKYINSEKTVVKKILTFMKRTLMSFIPIYNVMNLTSIITMNDIAYGYLKKELLEHGKIYKSDETESFNEESKPSNQESVLFTRNTKSETAKKSHQDITREEKLAYLREEREKLINQKRTAISQFTDDSFDGSIPEQRGPVFEKVRN